MLKQGKSKNFLTFLTLIVFFAAGYFYSGFRNSPKPSTSTSKTATEIVPESESPLEFVDNNQSNTDSILAKYYPLQKGNYWEYEGTKREQLNAKDIEISNVKKKVEVVDVQETEEGTVIVFNDSISFMVRDNNIYSSRAGGKYELEFPFPFYVGQKWGDEDSLRYREDNSYVWYVEEKFSKRVLGEDYDECFKISYKTNPDSSYYIFCYGLGIVEEGYKHNGTVLELKNVLTNTNVGM